MSDRITWLDDLIRVQILLWDRVDARLRDAHDVTLARFQALHALAGGPARVGDLAQRMSITVGGASKLADRMVTLGLLAREPDPDDRRASRLALTGAGRDTLAAASVTYAEAVAEAVDPVLPPADRDRLHELVGRLLTRLGG
ncbi:MarR family winged helix-turn-helix transcriptional regulator [Catenuloplanes atrovinosus]|uniref:DNA-binding MarR family transcriptional regulator n=1 Tax=Catenuloplanes atrovinosus TaxID=137266 RepID=A0AAE3YQ99_9ACTN|nr:MarR family transcriptional regulator [Catenuloplanes atrovinosus]MDR7276670.1 DNA-binding MarR family transcriptional regulator [Catenuloplanes atrovinosus]